MFAIASSANAVRTATPVRAKKAERAMHIHVKTATVTNSVTAEKEDSMKVMRAVHVGGGRRAALFSAAAAAVTAAGFTTAFPASANVKYANDCDPICHILDDGAAKSQKMEQEMKSGGSDMGSAMEALLAQRKAEEKAAAGAAATAKADAKPRGF